MKKQVVSSVEHSLWVRELLGIGFLCVGLVGAITLESSLVFQVSQSSEPSWPTCFQSPRREGVQPKDCGAVKGYTSWGGTSYGE